MDKLVLIAQGRNGSVELYQNRLIIKRKAFAFTKNFTTGDKEIYLDNIKNINYKIANFWTFGFIQIETGQNSKELKKGSLVMSPTDEFTVNFNRKQESKFVELKNQISILRNSAKSSTVIQNQLSEAEEIEKLANLKEKGIITQEEFDAKKKKILGL